MAKDLKVLLKKYGFSQTESVVYMYLFKKGAATVQEIVDGTKVPRSTVYDVLDSFKNAGLVSYLESKPKRKYVIESPHQIANYIEQSYQEKKKSIKSEFEERQQEFKDSVHKLLSAQDNVRPRVRFYEGIHGINAMREDALNSKVDRYQVVFNYDDTKKTLERGQGLFYKDIEDQIKKIPSSNIYTSALGDVLNKSGAEDHSKVFSYTEESIPAEIVIYGDRVAMIDHRGDTITVIIENKNIAETIRSLFTLSKKYLSKK